MSRRAWMALSLLSVFAAASSLQGAQDIPLRNWPVPGTSGVHTLGTLSDIGGPNPFIAVTPCRVVDTRLAAGPFGGPAFTSGQTRSFTIPSGPCSGIPTSAKAFSLNFTVVNMVAGDGFLTAWPAGTTRPLVSTLDYVPVEGALANAAIVPAGSGGAISVFVNVGTNVIIDINGYFGPTPTSGAGMTLNTNTGGYTFYGLNISAGCGGPCGFFSEVDSATSGVNAVEGYTPSSAGTNFATTGFASGTSHSTGFDSANSAGVYGEGDHSSAAVNGVTGRVPGSNLYAFGVYGEAAQGVANAMGFKNVNGGANITGFMGSVVAGTSYGLNTNGHITGSNIAAPTLGSIAPHPSDASLQISYLSVEAPTADIYFRGTANLSNGYARIEVPDHFRLTARGDSYMTTLTAVGSRAALYIESEGPDGIEVRGAGNGTFHYVVYAERDALRDHRPVEENSLYRPETLAKGHTLDTLPAAMRADLIKNGTLNTDGTYNQSTAARLGWTVPQPEIESTAPPARPTK